MWLTSVLAVALCTPAMAAEKVDIGLEFRAALEHNDNGIAKTESNKAPSKYSAFNARRVKLNLSGAITDEISYRFRYDMLYRSLDYAYLQEKKGILTVRIGKQKVRQGGFVVKNTGLYNFIQSPYEVHGTLGMPFPRNDTVLTIGLDIGTKITVSILDDVKRSTGGFKYYNDADKQQTYLTELHKEFDSGFEILGQSGSYDLNHSSFISLGVRFKGSDAMASFDYTLDSRNQAKRELTPEKERAFIIQNITLLADYELKGFLKPFLKYATYQVSKDEVQSLKDTDVNSGDPKSLAASGFDDNAVTTAVGAHFLSIAGAGYAPYFAYMMQSGDFYKDGVSSKGKETRTNTQIQLGVTGSF